MIFSRNATRVISSDKIGEFYSIAWWMKNVESSSSTFTNISVGRIKLLKKIG